MNKTVAEAEQYIAALLPRVAAVDGVEIVVCPPFLALQALVDSARGSQVAIYAQNMHEADARRVHRRGRRRRCWRRSTSHGVVLGHSERRQYFGETDKALQLKVPRRSRRASRRSSASARPRRSASAARRSASCATRCRKGSRRCPPSGWQRS